MLEHISGFFKNEPASALAIAQPAADSPRTTAAASRPSRSFGGKGNV